jgi:small subunit ribosomal protein S20
VAHHKSAKVRIRRNERRRLINKNYVSSMRSAIKRFRVALSPEDGTSPNLEIARPLLKTAQSLIAKAAQRGKLHSKTASRQIGRLTKFLDRVEKSVGTDAPMAAKAKKVSKKVSKKAAAKKKKTAKKAAAKKKTAKKKK